MKRSILLLLAVVVLVPLLSSCTQDGVSPRPTNTPEFVQPLPSHAGTKLSDTSISLPDNQIGTTVPRNVRDNVDVTGGVVSLGRYTVIVPPYALPQATTITLTKNSDFGPVGCSLRPHLVFNTPVLLVMDLSGTTAKPGDNITIYWWDPANSRWVDMHGTFDPVAMTVSALVPHFSDYDAGRGGW